MKIYREENESYVLAHSCNSSLALEFEVMPRTAPALERLCVACRETSDEQAVVFIDQRG